MKLEDDMVVDIGVFVFCTISENKSLNYNFDNINNRRLKFDFLPYIRTLLSFIPKEFVAVQV